MDYETVRKGAPEKGSVILQKSPATLLVHIIHSPEKYIREMVADWMGAGLAITGRMEVIEWYGKNATKMLLHPRSRARVEELLKDVENYYRVGRMLGFVAS